jgi:hypothetical protein
MTTLRKAMREDAGKAKAMSQQGVNLGTNGMNPFTMWDLV